MRSGSRGEIPVEIERARLSFAKWRKNRKKVTRIPDRLWDAAVDAARLHGVNPTAIALGLDYNHLKERTPFQATGHHWVVFAPNARGCGSEHFAVEVNVLGSPGRMTEIAAAWLPAARILHPLPEAC